MRSNRSADCGQYLTRGGANGLADRIGRPISVRIAAGGRSNDNWYYPDNPITIDAHTPENGGPLFTQIDGYSYWDTEAHGAIELAVELKKKHQIGARLQTNVTNSYSNIDLDVDGGSYRRVETDLQYPVGLAALYHLQMGRRGLRATTGWRLGELRYPDDEVFETVYGDVRWLHHYSATIGPSATIWRGARRSVDLSVDYIYEVADLCPIFGSFKPSSGGLIEIGVTRACQPLDTPVVRSIP